MVTQQASIYTTGEYLSRNPTWHVEDSGWKAARILAFMKRSRLSPQTVCEVGCGAGEILRQLQSEFAPPCEFYGYEISPQAYRAAQGRNNPHLHFKLADILEQPETRYDLMLLIDVIEHLENCHHFLRKIRMYGKHTILHIPLDLSVHGLLRRIPELRRRTVGHVQYFTKELALATLRDAGHHVIDYVYTSTAMDRPQNLRQRLGVLPKRVCFSLNQDLTVRLIAGWSLLVLCGSESRE